MSGRVGVSLRAKCGCDGAQKDEPCAACSLRRSSVPGAAAGPAHAPAIVNDVVRGGGEPLPARWHEPLAPLAGGESFDFSRLRVHTDEHAAASAALVGARAYTVGNHLVFGRGQFAPGTRDGAHLLAHEVTHAVQQGGAAPHPGAPLEVGATAHPSEAEADRAADAWTRGGRGAAEIRERPGVRLARTPLDVPALDQRVKTESVKPNSHFPMVSHLVGAKGTASGEIGFAADYPTTFTMPADKTKRVKDSKLPDADAVTPLSKIPIEAHFFGSPLTNVTARAVVVGGFHGDERPGWEMVEGLIKEIKAGSFLLRQHIIVVPRLNAAAIADELAGVNLWHNRCNRQIVDLNRNFPTGEPAGKKTCRNNDTAPVQPETQAVMKVITDFKPERIVSGHNIDTLSQAGVYADPNQDPDSVALAQDMASTLVNPSDRPGNFPDPKNPTKFNPTYPLDKPGAPTGRSLGVWGVTAMPDRITPVITIEAPGDTSLATGTAKDPRTVAAFTQPLIKFLDAPGADADAAILADIDAFTLVDRVGLLTGTLAASNKIHQRVGERLARAIARLNSIRPKKLPELVNVSGLRLFREKTTAPGGGTPQAEIVFEKFFLTGSRSGGWDSLPPAYRKADGKVDKAKWLAEPTQTRLDAILKFSALPGASRHHWGTEVDFNSTSSEAWAPAVGTKKAGKLHALGVWLDANAARAAFIASFSPGRSGGYSDEPWHYSYAPLSIGLRTRYNKDVKLATDVADAVIAEFTSRAAAAGITLPTDFATGVKAINIATYVNTINPKL